MLATVMDAIAAPVPDKCLAAQDTDWMTFTISLGLAFGIVLSYLPQVPPPRLPFQTSKLNKQHYRIIDRKSSEGISPYFLLLGGTSSSSAFLNILILQKEILACCQFTVRPFRFGVILTYRQNGHVSYNLWE